MVVVLSTMHFYTCPGILDFKFSKSPGYEFRTQACCEVGGGGEHDLAPATPMHACHASLLMFLDFQHSKSPGYRLYLIGLKMNQ